MKVTAPPGIVIYADREQNLRGSAFIIIAGVSASCGKWFAPVVFLASFLSLLVFLSLIFCTSTSHPLAILFFVFVSETGIIDAIT